MTFVTRCTENISGRLSGGRISARVLRENGQLIALVVVAILFSRVVVVGDRGVPLGVELKP